jgi:hypothetical protein
MFDIGMVPYVGVLRSPWDLFSGKLSRKVRGLSHVVEVASMAAGCHGLEGAGTKVAIAASVAIAIPNAANLALNMYAKRMASKWEDSPVLRERTPAPLSAPRERPPAPRAPASSPSPGLRRRTF